MSRALRSDKQAGTGKLHMIPAKESANKIEPAEFALPCSGGPSLAAIQDHLTEAQWATLSKKQQQTYKHFESNNPNGTMHHYNSTLFPDYNVAERKRWEQEIKEINLAMEEEQAAAIERRLARERVRERAIQRSRLARA